MPEPLRSRLWFEHGWARPAEQQGNPYLCRKLRVTRLHSATACNWKMTKRARRSGGLGSPPGYCPRFRLPFCVAADIGEEQRPPGRATAWWPSLGFAAELGFPRLGYGSRGRTGGEVRNASAFPQVTGRGSYRTKLSECSEFVPLNCAPGRILTCAHGSGEVLCTPLTSGNEFPHTMIGGASGAATAGPGLPGTLSADKAWRRVGRSPGPAVVPRAAFRPALWVRVTSGQVS